MKKIFLVVSAILLNLSVIAQWDESQNGKIITTDNVGIGTLSPNRNLTLESGGSTYLNIKGNDGVREVLIGVDQGSAVLSAMTNHDLQLRAGSNSTKMTIKTNGSIGIGTTSPNRNLTIESSGSSYLNIKGNDGVRELLIGVDQKSGLISTMTDHDLHLRAGGNLTHMAIKSDGNVGIGITDPKNKLSVNGTIWAKEVKVSLIDGADWVFEDDYNLRSLEEVEAFVKTNKHLPDVPSADEFRENDMNLGEMNNILLQKMEEMTLYMIFLNKGMKKLEAKNEQLEKKLSVLKNK